MTVLFDENFNTFRGLSFASSPVAGQLDSDRFRITGLSSSMAFGDTRDTDRFAQGETTGDKTSGGIYAFDRGGGDYALGVQPTTGLFTPGTIEVAVPNTTGAIISEVDIAYDIVVFNDRDRSSSFNFSYENSTEKIVLE